MSLAKINCIFVGGIPHKSESLMVHDAAISNPQFAAEEFQFKLFYHLKKLEFKNLIFLSFPYTGVYKVHTKLKFYRPKLIQDKDFSYFSFSTIPFLYSAMRSYRLFMTLTKKSKVLKNESLVVFIYAVHLPFLFSVVLFKFLSSANVKVILITPDLPEYTSSRSGFISRLIKSIKYFQVKASYFLVRFVDGHITFTDTISEVVNKNLRPNFTLLGLPPSVICDGINISEEFECLKSKKYIKAGVPFFFYGGGLNERYGINKLIDAFVILLEEFSDIHLVLCGRGDSVEYIRSMAKKYPQIAYLGVLNNHEALSLQKNATALVNPRRSGEKFVEYSFPSKMIEYLDTGLPVVAYKLPTYPDELNNIIIMPDGYGVQALSEALRKSFLLSDAERQDVLQLSKKFIEKYCSDESVSTGLKTLVLNTLRCRKCS